MALNSIKLGDVRNLISRTNDRPVTIPAGKLLVVRHEEAIRTGRCTILAYSPDGWINQRDVDGTLSRLVDSKGEPLFPEADLSALFDEPTGGQGS